MLRNRTIFEKSKPGLPGKELPTFSQGKALADLFPEALLRSEKPMLPEVNEVEVIRHFTELAEKNYHVDKGFYPLGSCTMKYNPKINEDIAAWDAFANLNPYQKEEDVQGALELMWNLQEALKEVSGFAGMTLQPAAGAHGEFTGLQLMRAYHQHKGNPRKYIIVPDSAHGTNPASVTMNGYKTVQIKSDAVGLVDPAEVHRVVDKYGTDIAGIMMTNPNTLGLFETHIKEISTILKTIDALIYMDGANFNALMGIVKPGEIGVDVMHFNLHKTFSTPHGGGGPGSGPVGCSEALKPFLPVPVIEKQDETFALNWDRPETIGKVHSFFGNFGVMVKAYAYIRTLGSEGIRRASENALINANYIRTKLQPYYDLPYDSICMHECVFSGDRQKKQGAKTLDIAKRLLDYGFHAPTVYFPLIVHEALMIEPTETESKEMLDSFIEAMIAIAKEAETQPELLQNAPVTTPVGRLDDVKAIKELNVRWKA